MPADQHDTLEIQRLIQAGNWAGAQALLRKAVAADPTDVRALKLFGAALLQCGAVDEAIPILMRSLELQPTSYASLVNMAEALTRANRHAASVEYYERAIALAPNENDRLRLALSLAEASASGGSFGAACAALVSIGILAPPHAAALRAGPDDDLDQIDERVLVRLQQIAVKAGEHQIVRRVGLRLRQRGSMLNRGEVLKKLMAAQMRLGLEGEWTATYLDGLERGDPVLDYRPKFNNASLAGSYKAIAEALYARDRDEYARWLASNAAFAAPPEAVHEKRSVAVTDGVEAIGLDAMVAWGTIAAASAGARYRFEFGPAPDNLSGATDWKPVPPPRRANVRERAYRIFGDWVPRSSKYAWVSVDDNDGAGGADRLAIRLASPFAKDRNQLAGIGSHEMPLNFGWCHADGEFRSPSFSVAGGILDLRDAQISVTVRGENLDQRGAALHFWIGRVTKDALGEFTSQWALTGCPFPDRALSDGQWHTVTFDVPSNPQLWTYTGNNPKEQGFRANRYRRAPLEDNIEQANDSFLFIFAFGAERKPPTGALDVFDIAARYRNHSILSRYAGARLIAQPEAGSDPGNLTGGHRGFDEFMWISEANPRFPLQFEWALPRPVEISRLQLNQHPYWPARQVEIAGLDKGGGWSILWSGEMTSGRPDLNEAPFSHIRLKAASPIVGVRLRILSGYHDERCGLDGIEIYGDGAVFEPDGDLCTVCGEIANLPAGRPVYARVIVEDGGSKITGEVKAVALPASRAPQILAVEGWLRPASAPCLVIRGNAFGLDTTVSATFTDGDGTSTRFETISLGSQPTARHIYFNLPAPIVSLRGTIAVELANAEGSDRKEIMWPPASDRLPLLLRSARVD